jgi:ubiquinone biosynthesis monooxygenase Coq7
MTERVRPIPPGEPGVKQALDEMIRVDHAGEYGAVQIYRGQLAVFEAMQGKERIASLLREMEKGEQEHLDTFDRLIADRDVRPTAMAPVWRLLGFGLGAATALMGEKAAHACTAAVEEVIEEHYAQQAKMLEKLDPELGAVVARYREDELNHRDTAILEGAKNAPAYGLLSEAIKFGCRTAIAVSKRI